MSVLPTKFLPYTFKLTFGKLLPFIGNEAEKWFCYNFLLRLFKLYTWYVVYSAVSWPATHTGPFITWQWWLDHC